MPTQRKLGRPTDQRKAILKNLVTALLQNGRIETTGDQGQRKYRLLLKS